MRGYTMVNSNFQKIIFTVVIFLLFMALTVSSSNNTKAWGGIGEIDIPYKLIATDPYGDVKNCTSEETIENNETVERQNIDLKDIYVNYNESTLLVKIDVWGEIEVSPWVEYRLSFESNISLPSPLFLFRNIRYKNGTATFEGEENKSIKCYSASSSLILEVPIMYLYDEGCIQNNSLHILSGSASELGTEEIDDESEFKYFYVDSLDSCFYFFSLDAKIISITPNPAVSGKPVQFTGVGGDPCENVTYEWLSSIDGFLSNNTSFTTRNLSVGNHTIYLRVRNSTTMIEKTINITVREESIFPSPNVSINIYITPNPAIEGETVYFTGSCNVSGNFMYEWRSNIDGILSNKSSFTVNNLSVGTHTITFRVWEGTTYWMIWEKHTSATIIIKERNVDTNDGIWHQLQQNKALIIPLLIGVGILICLIVIKMRKRKNTVDERMMK
jgi:hypothetical protein